MFQDTEKTEYYMSILISSLILRIFSSSEVGFLAGGGRGRVVTDIGLLQKFRHIEANSLASIRKI